MGVSVRKKGGKWFVFIRHNGRRKAKAIGDSKAAAEQVKRILEAKLALGEFNVLNDEDDQVPTFDAYADRWLKEYASIEVKSSTKEGYEGVLKNYLRPRFGKKQLDSIKREDLKVMIAELIEKKLSRGTIKNAIAVIRKMFSEAMEAEIVQANPATKMGRFTKAAHTSEKKGVALTPTEAQVFLEAAKEVCPDYYPLFLVALRAGLRRGELVALQFGDVNFGDDEEAGSRYLFIQHNYVRREHTTTKSRKARRVDMSRELRRVLMEIRDKRLAEAKEAGKSEITDEVVFHGPDGGILDPDNLYHRYFLPVLVKAGIRKIRLHDLRHTFGSQLIQSGASIVYVKEQMGHSSIQVTVDIYGHLIPGANVSFVDRLDVVPAQPEAKPEPEPAPESMQVATDLKPVATPAQPREFAETAVPSDVVDLIGGGGRTRTYDLRIMRPSL